MAKKPGKRQFDWMTYSKPPRLLTSAQEESLASGLLAPLLELVLADPRLRLEIRARSASLYDRGTGILRLVGEPFDAELEGDADAQPQRLALRSPEDVGALLGEIDKRREIIDREGAGSAAAGRRGALQALAQANRGDDLFSAEYVVLDLEYTYGKRRYDLTALRRLEGVTGPGGFAHPRLVFVDVRTAGQALTGANGLEAVAADFAEFVKAASGSHLARAREECLELVHQKVRLGLLGEALDVRSLAEGLPELLVAFAGYDGLSEKAHDPSLSAMHDRLVSRHFPPERLRFVDLEGREPVAIAVAESDVMDYRAFKDHRTRGRQ